jgi:PmbA protein
MVNPAILQNVLKAAARQGASDAEVIAVESREFTVTVRRGEVESLTQSGSRRLGMRLFQDLRSACSSSADLTTGALEKLVSETLALAAITSEDPAGALPDKFGQACDPQDLCLYDENLEASDPDARIELALRAENAALKFDPRIANSEGAIFSSTLNTVRMANSRGFDGQYRSSSCTLQVAPLAAQNGEMQRDFWYSTSHRLDALESPEALGRKAAERVLRRLGGRKVATQQVPVVFDPETAAQLLSHLADAASGQSIYRRSSFLTGKLGQQIAAPGLHVIDDGRLPGGLGSRPFDGDGTPTQRTVLVEAGMLKNYLNNTYTARKLGMQTTGNASRGIAAPADVGPTNLYVERGPHSPEEIIASIPSGLYVTELIGFGVNIVNGDYSQGVTGLWIENGKLTFPVQEITIAGNLPEMLKNIEMIGNDLEPRGPIYCPTMKIRELVISGQ